MLRFLSRALFGIGVITAASLVLPAQPAFAVGQTGKPAAHPKYTTQPNASNKRYFVEFRGRSAASYGHLYVMYGQVNARGEIIRSKIAGLYPSGDQQDCENCSLANWMIGHVVFVPSGTTATDGDLEEKYVTARYRVMLDKVQYQKLVEHIAKFQANPPLWHAILRNCVSFGREIAGVLDLNAPAFPWLTPEQFVEQLREMNGTRDGQAPLKDSAGEAIEPATTVSESKPKQRPVRNAQRTPQASAAAAPSR
jgi:hypothetical protein